MNKILVEVSVGELLDKISILEIKKERIKDPDKLKFIKDEYEIPGNTLTYYSWETKEFGRIATLVENKFSLMTQNNFNIVTATENISLSGLEIFPNPAKDNFTVKINALENVKVFDAIGNLVFNQTFKSNSININTTSFNRGIYFVQATADGNVSTSRIIVK